MPTNLPSTKTTSPNQTDPSDPETTRHIQIGVLLANQLDMMLMRYKTPDGKVLTEGEVMQAFGNIIGSHSPTRERVEEWLRNVANVAFHQQLINQSKPK